MAAFELKDYVGSKQSLDKGLALCSDARRQQLYERALRKCDAELKGTLIIVTLLLCTIIWYDSVTCPIDAETIAPTATPTPAVPAAVPVVPQRPSIRYEYYQSLERLTISVLAKNLNPSDVRVDITSNRLYVSVKHGNEEEVVINKQLYSTIDATKSAYNIQKNKIEIILYKLLHQNWPCIEGNAEAFIELSATYSAPSSSSKVYATELPKPYATKKDWNSITSR